MQIGSDTGTPKMRTIWDTGRMKMQTKMLGHRDTKNADRLGQRDKIKKSIGREHLVSFY